MKTFSIPPELHRVSHTDCNFCGKSNTRPYLRCKGYTFVKCGGCGLVYQNPRPESSLVPLRYGDDYFTYEKENDENFFQLMLKGLQDVEFDIIEERFTAGGRFLDVGCATGMLLEHMKKRGWEEKGVEICAPAARCGRETRGVDIFEGTLEQAHFPDSHFHVVHSSHVVEHLEDPLAFFSEIRRILKPHGFMVLTTPNIRSFQAGWYRTGWRSAIADHLYLFTRKTITMYLRRTGFKPLRWKTWGGIPAGDAPAMIKRPADSLAKKLNCGDVMIFLSQPVTT